MNSIESMLGGVVPCGRTRIAAIDALRWSRRPRKNIDAAACWRLFGWAVGTEGREKVVAAPILSSSKSGGDGTRRTRITEGTRARSAFGVR